MSGRTSWTRLWVSHRSHDVTAGLESRLADPLWLLARQWQFGGFEGDNAASLASVHVEQEVRQVTDLTGNNPRDQKTPLGAEDLLETVVECGETINGPAAIRIAGEAGVQFLRLFDHKKSVVLRRVLRDAFPLEIPESQEQNRNTVLLRHLSASSFDARHLYAQKAAGKQLADESGIDLMEIERALKTWSQYYEARFAQQPKSKLWQENRQEYEFGVDAKAKDTRIGLRARDYAGGHLDWTDFDITATSGNNKKAGRITTNTLIPTPVSYSGMPAERYWDFEDGEVFFGGLTVDKTDLAQLILTEFATVYSNDWFMLPLPTETGTLNRIQKMTVKDVFGETTIIEPSSKRDGNIRPWRFFELAGDPSAEQGLSPWLFLPRSVVGGDAGRAVEQVIFTRDEMANLAWGIETNVEGPGGTTIQRDQHWKKRRDAVLKDVEAENNKESKPDDEAPWVYRLITVAPPFWVPFLPEIKNNIAQPNLVRARMREWDLLGVHKEEFAGAKGRLMVPDRPLCIREEEIPEGGIKVSRHYQTARSPDGRLLLWSSNQKQPAAGSVGSGRETDKLERGSS